MYKMWLENNESSSGISCEVKYMSTDELKDMDRSCCVCWDALSALGCGRDPSERKRIEKAKLEALGLTPVAVPLIPTTEIIWAQNEQTGKLN
jgi:hypothetical protein